VSRLVLDGDREISMLCPRWWHFGRHFSITNLDGIGRCTALVDLDLNSMVEPCGLAPLAGLTGLRRLTVDAADRHRNLDTVAALPALAELKFWNLARAEADEAVSSVIGASGARGVPVHAV
jgi:hypothetical protein